MPLDIDSGKPASLSILSIWQMPLDISPQKNELLWYACDFAEAVLSRLTVMIKHRSK